MSNTRPSDRMVEALIALRDERYDDAMRLFREAAEDDRSKQDQRRRLKCLSYFGLSASLASRPTPDSIRACHVAARVASDEPDMHLNYGRVLALAGRRTRALEAFERGLRLNPSHRALRGELERLDRRSKPPVPFLSRRHPINKCLGRLLANWTAGSPAAKQNV